ncbi:unnamed protein product [Closterium sp. NIES-65]|nr:unnamed protein product [Closterium sp. NIES-65]
MDDAASADVPTPRLPRRRPLDGTAERRGAGDASKCGATSTAVPLGSRLVPSPQTDNSQTLDAVGLLPGSDNEQRCAAVDDTKEGGESLGAAVAAAALGARPGFVWQCGSSACLNPSSSNATTDGSRDGSAGGGSSGEENPERSHALAGRAGNSLFDDWTDLRGRRPRVAGGGSGTAPGKEALVKATEGRRPIFHQKAPSGRILQEVRQLKGVAPLSSLNPHPSSPLSLRRQLFDLESGPLDLEFLVSLRTLSRSSSSSTRSSSARSSTYARDTPTATPSQPLASLVTASPAPAPAAASDGPALPGAASASASPGSEATTESAGAASAESHVPQSSALVPATPGAPARDEGIDNDSDAADDCSVDEEDEAAAAAASAWAAVELVDVSSNTADARSRTNSLGMAGDGFSHDDLALAIALSLAESDPGIRLALENPSRPTSSAERGRAGGIAQEPRKDWSISGFASSGSSRGGAEGSTAAELRERGGEAERWWERNPREARDVITIDDEAEGEAEEAESWSRKVEGVVPLPAVPPPPDPDLLDPCPDITALFRHYNDLYFQGRLGACLVEWSSKRMTLCAGVCMYDGALCRIRLSAPLLQYRPVSDLKATLLHEMIHAFIFLCRPSHSREDHGPMFQGIMGTINTSTLHDHQISVYHSFKDEVNVHRRHAWQVPWVGRRGCRGVWGGCRGSGGGCGGVVR